MKEIKPRQFILEDKEFKQRLQLPESGDVTSVEVNPDGSILITMIGEV